MALPPSAPFAARAALVLVTAMVSAVAAAGANAEDAAARDAAIRDAAARDAAIRDAATFYASFDASLAADLAAGGKAPGTRFDHPTEKGQFVFEKEVDGEIFRVDGAAGIQGGALRASDVLPRRGRIYYPAAGNLPFRPEGWGGAVSMWLNTDPNKLLKTPFCDPVQITHRGANNGGLWIDFPDVKPRGMRLGAFSAVPEGQKGVSESDPDAPLVHYRNVPFVEGKWHHVAFTWGNFDTGRNDAHAALYVDGKLVGALKDRAIAMRWDLDKTGIYVAVNYVGLLDELAIFDRPLAAAEIARLGEEPKLLAELKSGKHAAGRLNEFHKRAAALASAAPEDAKVAALRRDIFARLSTAAGRRQAESLVAALEQLPRGGAPPRPPEFPFPAKTARAWQEEYARWRGLPAEFENGQGLRFRLVPPGSFLMGSPDDEPGHNANGYDEGRHAVTLTRPFYLAATETTVEQFRRFVEAAGYVTDGEKNGGGHAHDALAVWQHRPGTSWRQPGYAGPFELLGRHPVVHVSHADSRAFCSWLQAQSALPAGSPLKYDLPTEAQWEWACRAGSGDRYTWGPEEDATGRRLNAGDAALKRVHPEWPRAVMPMDDGHAYCAPVALYEPNAFGLFDMLGNVWEFSATRYGPPPREAVTDPGDASPNRGYAVRGGGWSNTPADVRCAVRNADPPHFCHSNLGFRVAMPLP